MIRNTVPLNYITTRDLRKCKSTAVLAIWRAVNNSSTLGHMSALTIDESYLSFFYLITGAGFWLKSHFIPFLFCKMRCRPQAASAQLSSSKTKSRLIKRSAESHFLPSAALLRALVPAKLIPILRCNTKVWRQTVESLSFPPWPQPGGCFCTAPHSTHSQRLRGEERHLNKLPGDSRTSSKSSQVGIWSLHFAFHKEGSKAVCAGALTLLGGADAPGRAGPDSAACPSPSHHGLNHWGTSSLRKALPTLPKCSRI